MRKQSPPRTGDPYLHALSDYDNYHDEYEDDIHRKTARHNGCAVRATFNRNWPLGPNITRNVTNRKIHGSWSGRPIDTVAQCDELYVAAATDDQALLYLDYVNAVSQPRGVIRSTGQQVLVTRWGSFIRTNRERRDARLGYAPTYLLRKNSRSGRGQLANLSHLLLCVDPTTYHRRPYPSIMGQPWSQTRVLPLCNHQRLMHFTNGWHTLKPFPWCHERGPGGLPATGQRECVTIIMGSPVPSPLKIAVSDSLPGPQTPRRLAPLG